jgi:hypothetical protein
MADLGLDASPMPVEIVDDTSGFELAINSDRSANVSLGNTAKTKVLKTGTLVTTAVTADQVVLTYTVTAGKTFFLEYVVVGATLTVVPGNSNPIAIGNFSLETPAGTKGFTDAFVYPRTISQRLQIGEPIPIAAGTVIRVVCTPAAVTSTTWIANFGGYER